MLFWARNPRLRTLVVDPKQPTFLCVTTETYQHLIGRAAWRVVGLSVREDAQFPGCLLRTVPEEGGRSKCIGDKGSRERWRCPRGAWDCLFASSLNLNTLPSINLKFKSVWHISERTKQSCVSDYCQASSYSASLQNVESNYSWPLWGSRVEIKLPITAGRQVPRFDLSSNGSESGCRSPALAIPRRCHGWLSQLPDFLPQPFCLKTICLWLSDWAREITNSSENGWLGTAAWQRSGQATITGTIFLAH